MGDRIISLSDKTLRRIQPKLVVDDPKAPSGKRASQAAFSDDPDGSSMSVYLKSVVSLMNLVDADVIDGKGSGWAVAATKVEDLRGEEQEVKFDPVENPAVRHICDGAHSLVVGDKSSKARRERIVKASPLVCILP